MYPGERPAPRQSTRTQAYPSGTHFSGSTTSQLGYWLVDPHATSGCPGTGRMGAAIGQRLMSLGHELAVWNRTAEKTRPLAAAGAKVAATPSRLVASSETIITILTDAAAIDAAYRGKDGLLAGDVAGKLFIEMSTVRP